MEGKVQLFKLNYDERESRAVWCDGCSLYQFAEETHFSLWYKNAYTLLDTKRCLILCEK